MEYFVKSLRTVTVQVAFYCLKLCSFCNTFQVWISSLCEVADLKQYRLNGWFLLLVIVSGRQRFLLKVGSPQFVTLKIQICNYIQLFTLYLVLPSDLIKIH